MHGRLDSLFEHAGCLRRCDHRAGEQSDVLEEQVVVHLLEVVGAEFLQGPWPQMASTGAWDFFASYGPFSRWIEPGPTMPRQAPTMP